jgi:hypothetical protein
MPKLAPRATKPIEIPAPILAFAKKNRTFRALFAAFRPRTSLAVLKISHREARDMLRDLGDREAALPSDVGADRRDFPLPGAEGWRVELCSLGLRRRPLTDTVNVNLLGPDFREPVALSRDEFEARYAPKKA